MREGVEQMLSPALPDREDNGVDFPLTSEMHHTAPKERETGESPRLRLLTLKSPQKQISTHKLAVTVRLLTK